jgi:hypothetical protein
MIAGAGERPADRPDPNTRRCDQCGHVWFAGERRHQYHDPSAGRQGDVEVLCALCLHKRRLARTAQ